MHVGDALRTSIYHVVGVMPGLAEIAPDGVRTAEHFAERMSLGYFGPCSDLQDFHAFYGPEVNGAFSRLIFPASKLGHFLIRSSGQMIAKDRLAPEDRALAEELTSFGTSPAIRRRGGFLLPPEKTARLLQALLLAQGNARVKVDPDYDGAFYLVRGHNMAALSKASRFIYTALNDDRNQHRDGATLANGYSFQGNPWHTEIFMQFVDGFGNLTRAGQNGGPFYRYPLVHYAEPGNVQHMTGEAAEEHRRDRMNYGWLVEVPNELFGGSRGSSIQGPYQSLKKALAIADGAMSALRAGRTYEIEAPSDSDIAAAHRMREARLDPARNEEYKRLRMAFLEENGFRPAERVTRLVASSSDFPPIARPDESASKPRPATPAARPEPVPAPPPRRRRGADLAR